MISKFAILTNIVFTSGVLAIRSSSWREARPARHNINYIGARDGADTNEPYYTTSLAAAVLAETPGTFTNVTGTFVVPTLSKGSNGTVSVWVGIDGANTCENSGSLQTGVDFTVGGGKAWYKWSPGESKVFDGMAISAGDEIRATVAASSTTSGRAVVENLKTGRTVTKELASDSSPALCERDVEWAVEDLGDESGNIVPFPHFGTVKFTNASASGPGGGRFPLDSAIIIDAKQYEDVLVSVSVSGDTVTISHV